MPAHVSYTTHDHVPSTVVPVIASFDSAGHIRPLYVRINSEDFHVHSSAIKQSFPGITTFDCMLEDNGCLKPLFLKYHRAEGVWTMPKYSR